MQVLGKKIGKSTGENRVRRLERVQANQALRSSAEYPPSLQCIFQRKERAEINALKTEQGIALCKFSPVSWPHRACTQNLICAGCGELEPPYLSSRGSIYFRLLSIPICPVLIYRRSKGLVGLGYLASPVGIVKSCRWFAGEPQNNEYATHDPYKTLFVGRINYETSESKLRREFETYGPIRKVRKPLLTLGDSKPSVSLPSAVSPLADRVPHNQHHSFCTSPTYSISSLSERPLYPDISKPAAIL